MAGRSWLRCISLGVTVVLAGLLALAAGAAPATFTSTDGPITIDDYSGGPTVAAPSPSVITVSAGSETVSKVTVTLHGLTHTCPGDLNVLLVAPNGSSVVLIAQTGSCEEPTGDVTFDDAAAASFADSNLDAAGTWRPAQDTLVVTPGECDWTGSLVSPAPAGPYGTTLASLTGGPASGTWKLYIEDGCGGDSGELASWSLTLGADVGPRGGYCSVAGNTNWLTGKAIVPGTFLDLMAGQVDVDPHYKGAVPSNFLQGLGISCDVPPGYVKTGEKVGYFGSGDPGQYTYYRKAS